ncbi:hypothetical protein H4R34_000811 [Dimargaris verticillata]|uniref:Uncharacterized protein n=1 Tax=Dimargaris verticillata TaxID=2761393 RepID=A0A9W8B9P6_9FUNG|nr:hypothetical protein H4R34_000811 [Dimargaris verticillata]
MKAVFICTLVGILFASGPLVVTAADANQGAAGSPVNWENDFAGYYGSFFVDTDDESTNSVVTTPARPRQNSVHRKPQLASDIEEPSAGKDDENGNVTNLNQLMPPTTQQPYVEAHDKQPSFYRESAPAVMNGFSVNTKPPVQGLATGDASGGVLPTMGTDSTPLGYAVASDSPTSGRRKTWLSSVKNKAKHAFGLTAKQSVYRVLNVAAVRALRNKPPSYDATMFFPNNEILYGVNVLPDQASTARRPYFSDMYFQFIPYATQDEANKAIGNHQAWGFFTLSKDGSGSDTDQLWLNAFVSQRAMSFSMANTILGNDVRKDTWVGKSYFL